MTPIDASKTLRLVFKRISPVDGVIRRNWKRDWVRSSSEKAEPLDNKDTNREMQVSESAHHGFGTERGLRDSRMEADPISSQQCKAPSSSELGLLWTLSPCHQQRIISIIITIIICPYLLSSTIIDHYYS